MADGNSDDSKDRKASRGIKHGIKPGKTDDGDQQPGTAAAAAKGIGGLTNIAPRPPAPGSAPVPTPKPSVPSVTAPKPNAPKPPTAAAPKPPTAAAPKPPTAAAPKPPTAAAPKPPTAAAPKPPTAAAPKPAAPKPAAPKPAAPKPAAAGPSTGQPLGGSLTIEDLDQLRIGVTAYVQQAGGKNLRLRSAPGLTGTVLDGLTPGTRMQLLDGPRPADGYTWWRIRTVDGREGWVAGSELVTRPEQ